ncbi:5-formyltetrahydrofolate cyclo-ligase family protein [Stieleria maiorica]|uniref:5-formyltetrahydrofolate cyclo-ligase n=1 Tax=Stieleria maiorica TaxID=2795974 RepID=A0A5B9MA23_9BACT|nr:5-formyltetrahydrofolate cyclo-ligase [Stieleria maiorica]QEF97076.1 5-formyltetrahydrofolate cyclo-ligase family protein [Stieleria maiorica]
MSLSRKDTIRRAVAQARRAQDDKQRLSGQVTERITSMRQYIDARCVLWYVHVRDEVRTQDALRGMLVETEREGKKIVVPYCVGDELALFHLRRWEDLSAGAFGILEPCAERRGQADRAVSVEELDLIVVPGVAFDALGGRLGHGRGFYDRLLGSVAAETVLVGAAFECQIVPEMPLDRHDVAMDYVATPQRLICCRSD